jgi:hypothetical protein
MQKKFVSLQLKFIILQTLFFVNTEQKIYNKQQIFTSLFMHIKQTAIH